MQEVKVLLGSTKEGYLAFGEFEIHQGDRPYFSASFNVVRPFDEQEIDEDYVEMYLEGFSKDTLYDMCDRYDCSPRDLPSVFLESSEVVDLVDCSLFPKTYDVGNISFSFESMSCGQHDLLKDDEMDEYTNQVAFQRLYDLWKTYHLKTLRAKELEEITAEVNELVKLFKEIDEDEWITKFLKDNYLLFG